MDFKQIEAFVNVVRFKSFSKAADAMFFTQPTISSHISNLENELGVKLLDRKGRLVEMTVEGTAFYRYAVEMINEREQAIEALGKNMGDIVGLIQIETSSIPGIAFLPEVLADFRKLHPAVRFTVMQSDTEEVIDNLTDRKGEIGFVGEKTGRPGFEYNKIFTDKVVMIAPKSYKLESTISMEQAVKYPYVWRESGSATRKSFESTAESFGYDKNTFEIAALFNDIYAMVRAVEQGIGVAIVSKKVAEVMADDKLDVVEIEEFAEDRSFYMVNAKNASLSSAAKAFREYVLDVAKAQQK